MFSKSVYGLCNCRYLFQLLMEAGCLEWAILVSVILRDSVLFLRVVNAASMADTHAEIAHIQSGLCAIEQWSTTDWFVSLYVFDLCVLLSVFI